MTGFKGKEDLFLLWITTPTELMAADITLKDEQTPEFLSPWTGDDETESEVSDAMSEGGGDASAVLYDVPLVFAEAGKDVEALDSL